MRSPDPTLSVSLQTNIAEVGGRFQGHIARTPMLQDGDPAGSHRMQGIEISLSYETEGRGDRDRATVYSNVLPVNEWGQLSTPFQIPVPGHAPISLDGRLIRVIWTIEATVKIQMAIDRTTEVPVLVVPKNGLGLYTQPHPLPAGFPAAPHGFEPPVPGQLPPAPGSGFEPPVTGHPPPPGSGLEPPAPGQLPPPAPGSGFEPPPPRPWDS